MADVLARLGHEGPLYLTQRGKPRAVLLDRRVPGAHWAVGAPRRL